MLTRLQFILSTTAYLLVCWHCLVHHGAASASPRVAPAPTQRLALRAAPPHAPPVVAPPHAPPVVAPPVMRPPTPAPAPTDDASIATALGLQRAIDDATAGHAVVFAPSSDVIAPASLPLIEAVASLLVRSPQWRVEVAGHTDDVGAEEANVDMSARRAAAVARVLAEHGVAYRRVRVVGKGSAQPIADNETAEGRARNRRIHFTVIRGGGA
ncbi:MAG: OmpA family protein [Polyangiales bacterium]